MTAARFADFGGRVPIKSDRLLPANMATVAENLDLRSGELRGIKEPSYVFRFPEGTNPKRAWRIELREPHPTLGDLEAWLSSAYTDAELVRSPLEDDTLDRWYLFEPDTAPKVTRFLRVYYSQPAYDLALPTPTDELVLTPSATTEPVETRVYMYTYVSEWGEETAPSPTVTVDVTEGGSVTLSGSALTPPSNPDGRDYTAVRIYRTVSGEEADSFFFVADVTPGDASYTDVMPNSLVVLNNIADTWNYDPPPTGLKGVRQHPSGALVGFLDNTVYFSVPYKPHAWPEVWKVSLADDIIGLEVWEQNVVVLTKSRPFMLYGSTPDTIGVIRYPVVEPCAAYGSIVGIAGGVMFAGQNALMLLSSAGLNNLTQDVIDEQAWADGFVSSTMSAVSHIGRYVALTGTGEGFILDPTAGKASIVNFSLEQPVVNIFEDLYTSDVYMLAGDVVYEWDPLNGAEQEYRWRSGRLFQTKPVNFGALAVHLEPRDDRPLGQDYHAPNEVLVKVWADDELVFDRAVGDREPARLPSGFRADLWQVEIKGFCRVYSATLAETTRELRSF